MGKAEKWTFFPSSEKLLKRERYMFSYILGPAKAICEGQRPLHTSAQKSCKGQMGSRGQVLQTESK